MFLRSIFAVLAAALLLVPSALAGTAPVPFKMDGKATGNTVTYVLSIGPSTNWPWPDVSVTLNNCASGQQTPIHVLRTRHLDGIRESLTLDKAGNLVWNVRGPALGVNPKHLSLSFVLPQGVGGPFFCIHAIAWTSGSDQMAGQDLPVPLK